MACLMIILLDLCFSMWKKLLVWLHRSFHSEFLAQLHRGKAKLLHWTLYYFTALWITTKSWYTWRTSILVQSKFSSDQLITLFDWIYLLCASCSWLACACSKMTEGKKNKSRSNDVLKTSRCKISSILLKKTPEKQIVGWMIKSELFFNVFNNELLILPNTFT